MGVGVLIGFFLLITVLLLAPLSFLFFKRRGKKWLGILIAFVIVVFAFSVLFMNTIDEVTHTKNDTRGDLKFASITLNDEFKVIENDVSGMPERLQHTKIKVSVMDRDRIIREISSAPDFVEAKTSSLLFDKYIKGETKGKASHTANYRFGLNYFRESLFDDGVHVPIRIVAYLNPQTDTMVYDRIED